MANPIVVKAEHVSKRFGDRVALCDINLEVPAGGLFGLVGPDGADKSSLLRILSGALSGAGSVALWGQPLQRSRARLCEQIGYVPQRFSLYGDLTVAENLRFIGRLYGMSAAEVQTAAAPLLDWAGMTPFADRQAALLSGGMKQKLALIAALVHSSRLLLLDEPTTAVDPMARLEFWQMLRELAGQGTTIIVSTVYLDEAGQCDQIAMMHEGSILAQGTPTQLQAMVPFQVIEVAVSGQDRHAAEMAVQALPGIRQAVPYGARWRVQVDATAKIDLGSWEAQLGDAGIHATVRTVPVSLEDVFVHLLETKGVGAA